MTTEERRRNKEREIRAAMERILSGGAIHTDGASNASTLAAEAGVSRQDLYRLFGYQRGVMVARSDQLGRPA